MAGIHKEIRTIAKGAGIIFFGTIVSVILKYAFELFLARNLGPELFGVFFLGFTIFKILERISVFGLHNGLIRYVSIYLGNNDRKRLKGAILLSIIVVSITSIIISSIVVPLSGIISEKIFNDIRLAPVLTIFSLVLIFNAITEMMMSSTQGFQLMKYKTIVRMLLEPGLRLVFAIVFIMAGWSLVGAAFAYVFSLLAGVLLAFILLKKVFPPIADRGSPYKFEVKKILGFSWPLAFVGFFNVIILQINTIMLGYYSNSQDVGVFGAVQRTSLVIQVILISFGAIFGPMIADLYNRDQLKKLEGLYKIVTSWIFMLSLPLFLIFVFFSREVLGIWGNEYAGGWISLIIVCTAMLFNCAVGPVKGLIMMTGRSRLNLLNDGAAFVITITLNILLIPIYGVLGAAISFAAAIFIVNIMGLAEVLILLKIHPYKLSFLKSIAAGAVVSAAIFITKRYIFNESISIIWLIALIIIFLLLYAGLMLVFRLNQEDKVVINMISSKFTRKNNLTD